jgi:hypothetical protein
MKFVCTFCNRPASFQSVNTIPISGSITGRVVAVKSIEFYINEGFFFLLRGFTCVCVCVCVYILVISV